MGGYETRENDSDGRTTRQVGKEAMSEERILIVDDDPALVDQLEATLRQAGFSVFSAPDGRTALQAARAYGPHLVILDITLSSNEPKRAGPHDGIEVLKQLRASSDMYVLMLSGTDAEIVKVLAFRMGADDYLTKPFNTDELIARVQAILRRGRRDKTKPASELAFQSVRIDPAARRAWCRGVLLSLTPIEYDLLYALASNPGHVLSREQLIHHAWRHNYAGNERTVDVHIGRLRRKLEEASAGGVITTVRGAGYCFED